MEVTIIETESYQDLIKKIDLILKNQLASNNQTLISIIGNEELSKILQVSKRTLQTYRDTGIINFIQVGSKIYYNSKDVQAFLESHLNHSFSKPKKIK